MLKKNLPQSTSAFVFQLGFRPFFILGSCLSILSITIWAAILLGVISSTGKLPPPIWHAHEMIFGFAGAALCGFLLTAVPTWCKQPPASAKMLLLLVAIFLLGRLSISFNVYFPMWLVALLNLSLMPTLFYVIAPLLFTINGNKNAIFIYIIISYWLCQVMFFYSLLIAEGSLLFTSLRLASYVLIYAIIVTVTRISMMLVNKALQEQQDLEHQYKPHPARRNMAAASFILFAAADIFYPHNAVTGWIALAAGAAQVDRLSDWHLGRVLLKPYVAIIYTAYLWIALALLSIGANYIFAWGEISDWRHGLYIGAIGSAICAVFSIAGLRHSGFDFPLPKLAVIAMLLISLAAIFRVFSNFYLLAALCWALAFCCYLISYYSRLTGKLRPEKAH